MARTRPRYSLIIPAYNEEAYLPRLLDSVDRARATCESGPDAIEVIIADNGSTDRTPDIARERGCRVVGVEKRIIGAVRNAGARVARGDVFAFVDADARLHPETFNEIARVLTDDSVIGGATGIRFERKSIGLSCTYALLVLVALLLRGFRTVRPLDVDGGVIFCRRRDFFETGTYREDLLFAEDVAFMLALKRLGRRRGKRLVSGTDARTIFSTRKFDEFGDWHYFLVPPRLLLTGSRKRDSWARTYWYHRRGAV